MYEHLDRMQRRVMIPESWISREEFEAESIEEQQAYYRWMLAQCGELADLI